MRLARRTEHERSWSHSSGEQDGARPGPVCTKATGEGAGWPEHGTSLGGSAEPCLRLVPWLGKGDVERFW